VTCGRSRCTGGRRRSTHLHASSLPGQTSRGRLSFGSRGSPCRPRRLPADGARTQRAAASESGGAHFLGLPDLPEGCFSHPATVVTTPRGHTFRVGTLSASGPLLRSTGPLAVLRSTERDALHLVDVVCQQRDTTRPPKLRVVAGSVDQPAPTAAVRTDFLLQRGGRDPRCGGGR
jgi:hypothetical protein